MAWRATLLGALIVGVLGWGVAPPAQAVASLSAQDKAFLTANAQGNMAEIAAADVALQRVQNLDIRNLATTLRADHQKAEAQLAAIARTVGFALPTTPNRAQLTQMQELKAIGKLAFDKAYLEGQLSAHQLAIQSAQDELRKGSDPTVLGYARTALKMVQTHLGLVNDTIKGTGADIPLASPPPALSTPAPVVTTGPLAHDAKTHPSSDAPWLIGVLVLVVLGAGGVFFLLKRSATNKR